MSLYRIKLPEKYAKFLTQPGGTLDHVADHVRDAETDPDRDYEPGWTYLDSTALDALRELTEDDDGSVSDDERGLRVWFEGDPYDVEHVRES